MTVWACCMLQTLHCYSVTNFITFDLPLSSFPLPEEWICLTPPQTHLPFHPPRPPVKQRHATFVVCPCPYQRRASNVLNFQLEVIHLSLCLHLSRCLAPQFNSHSRFCWFFFSFFFLCSFCFYVFCQQSMDCYLISSGGTSQCHSLGFITHSGISIYCTGVLSPVFLQLCRVWGQQAEFNKGQIVS